MPYIPNSNTRPVGPDDGSILSDINVAEVILKILAGDGRTPPRGGKGDDATLPEPGKSSTWIMNFGSDPRSPVSPGDFDPSTITDPDDEIARRTEEEGEVHPLIRLMSPDSGPRFPNGGPDGQGLGPFVIPALVVGFAVVVLAALWYVAEKLIPDPVVIPPPSPDQGVPDEPPPPDAGEDNEMRDPDAQGGPVDDSKFLRDAIVSVLGKGFYRGDPSMFMTAAKATVDGLMTGKLNALGLLLTERQLNGGGNIGMSLDDARKLADDPAVKEALDAMPIRPDLEGAAYLIQVGHVFQKLPQVQAVLSLQSLESENKRIKT
jgi:hypothetical protein